MKDAETSCLKEELVNLRAEMKILNDKNEALNATNQELNDKLFHIKSKSNLELNSLKKQLDEANDLRQVSVIKDYLEASEPK